MRWHKSNGFVLKYERFLKVVMITRNTNGTGIKHTNKYKDILDSTYTQRHTDIYT